ncbi:MAG: response regulator [Candidatus Sericytochromatia bacterium]|nr:response regulator [Candidatus Sericytochromatia bacterium]
MTRDLTEDSPIRVMIVDDEPIIRLDLREMLEERGYLVVAEAADGEAAVEMALAERPDLLFMDIKMPRLDGLGALQRIQQASRIPAIMLTAWAQPDLVEQAVDLGVYGYLVKPVKEAELVPAIEVALARADEMRALEDEVGTLEGEVETLRETLETRKLVERAKGILMEQAGLAEAAAFRRIQKLSMDKRKSLKEIAEAIILAAEMNMGR